MAESILDYLTRTGLQNKIEFGSRVLTSCGKKGIVNFCGHSIDLCRVYYDQDGATHSVMVKISECALLSMDEAIKQ